MLNRLALAASVLLAMAAPLAAQETAPFAVTPYGHFQKMMHMENTDGVVYLAEATQGPHLYGVGAKPGMLTPYPYVPVRF